MTTWQPIGTAPRLKNVLVFYTNANGKGRVVKAFQCGKFEHKSSEESEHAEYCEEKDAYYDPPGWYEVIDNWDEFTHIFIHEGDPTEWQPLPDPPAHRAP